LKYQYSYPYLGAIASYNGQIRRLCKFRNNTLADEYTNKLSEQFAGIALTTSILHLSLATHQKNRLTQGALLRQQRDVLDILSHNAPPPPPIETGRRFEDRGIVERAKERWNDEVVRGVRAVESVDWGMVREQFENGVVNVWGKLRSEAEKK
jgi:MICOS complex subunit MIC12